MRHRGVLIACLVACLVAAACSGNDDSPSGSDASSTAGHPNQVAAKPSAGCRAATAVTPGEEKVTTTSGGAERWYYRHVPPSYDPTKPIPVVVDLHGYSEGAQVHLLTSDLGHFGDEKGFVTITPQGTAEPIPRWDTNFDSKDYAYIGHLLDEVDRTLCVDQRRVFVTGYSNGAFLTSSLVCKYADRLAAVAPVAGIRDVDGCKPSRPVPVVAFHGTDDQFVSYNGGYGSGAAKLPAPDGSNRTLADTPSTGPAPPSARESIPEITAAWAKRNGCAKKPTETSIASDVTKISYHCPAGDDVVLYRVQGGGHSWPGSAFSKNIAAVVGKTTDSISANEIMWEFFRAHPLPAS